ncbi:4-hydroxybutyryl-CoA dehydratase / vinylacetyl-CoA-Delta-isomerase [Desulfotomaculum arcticum]|uniref:4-hydroxybutyryl-CoA dehydratase / vinylacetyl-CoA-Delta-isomerase n=1 Tax=Desulfotruncus arcticus DSM 17038 TaxID=1121424 RepID=A0A1I2N215_9FIRM|nr:4-hydroxyphenylacetate 3-hydroxylase family protein [Desulfotruncus arcticus]SFF97792.1 4-hydroxybutyryl-CoA dehydratase / vinylacetyl-CoA-Delta-isomerase [Desulfotomaculum arcticum] [Desulfotruncus arcticus DSM 17038]
MALKTTQEYLDSLRKLDIKLYMFGELLENFVDHPIVRPSINSVAKSFELAADERYSELMTTTSNLSGETINRFTHLHQSTDDLVSKVQMLRMMGQKTASCFQRCVGMDAINALDSVTFEMDQQLGSVYHQRFRSFLQYVQDNDLVVDGAMTDPKGDRSLRPSEQADPDLYLRVVSESPDGIVVRGAKVHQTGAINSHEICVMPTIAMAELDKDYAVSFAVPSDTPGIFYIYGRQSCDTRKMEGSDMDVGNARYGGQEALVIFEDVFVPKERVFMLREYQFAGNLVERFAGYHRQSYGGCKVGVGDVLIGAAAMLADYNGAAKASHIKDKLIEMIHLNETLYSCGIACSCQGHRTSSGTFLINQLLANVCKQNVTRFPYEISRLAEDIAGGLMVTMPSEKDFRHPKIGPYIEKYFRGVQTVPTEHRMRMLRLVENMTLGCAAVGYRTESMHGAGSPQAQRIMISRQANLDYKKKLARVVAGIEEDN